MRMTRLFCDNWEFCKVPLHAEYSDSYNWSKIDIPHDWLIWDTNNLYESSTGWYRRRFDYSVENSKRICLRFDGVYMDSKVFVNGNKAYEWKYGYSAFEVDITDYLINGENLISVKVNYDSPNTRWYSGAGIFRDVYLIAYPDAHICSDGVYITADIDGKVTVTTEAQFPANKDLSKFLIKNTVFDGKNAVCTFEQGCTLVDNDSVCELIFDERNNYSSDTAELKIENPDLWDIKNPKLYTLRTTLYKNGESVDEVENKFGFRKIEFNSNEGFFLNNKHIKLHGCNEHHDLGALGSAFNINAMRRKFEKLTEMGVNSVRTSHNMPAKEVMDLADEMGILIFSDGFDMWELPKTKNDYSRFFKDWVSKDVASWIRRDRNHPSLIIWGIGNEIYDTHASEHGQEITGMLVEYVRKYDWRNNAYITIGSNYMISDNAQKCADIVKLAGYNYAEHLYDEHHKKYPDWAIFGSETASTVQSRGIYRFPLDKTILTYADEQCSSLGNCTTGWGAKNTEFCIIADRDRPYCAGQYIWTGFDYIGEPTPYQTKNSYFGQIDTAGFEKDTAFIYKGEWTDYKEKPFVHIFPYWDFIDNCDIDVRVASNAPFVKLFFNGEEVASKHIDHNNGTQLTLNTVIKYQKGELCAVAFDENGNEIARDVKRSFGDTAKFEIKPDKFEIKANGTDLIFVEISAVDSFGEPVANANNRVLVEVSGAGRLVGLDNGDSTDYEQYKSTSRRLFSGKLLAIIGAKTVSGEIKLTVSSPSLETQTITFNAVECEKVSGISAIQEIHPENSECKFNKNDIPIRKIAFESKSYSFDKECREIDFGVIVSPKNATYNEEIEYCITNILGIETPLAEIVKCENGVVRVRANGDGVFYLRALSKNGTDKYHIVTSLKLQASGIGCKTLNPYEFTLGGLRTIEDNVIKDGREQGVEFGDEDSWFGYDNIDFGKVGSEKITLTLFTKWNIPVKLRIYDGTPNDGGEIVGDYIYQAEPTKPASYKTVEYRLSKVLKGVHRICFESNSQLNLKGFCFEERKKEEVEILSVENDNIYGDNFTVNDSDITNIGNNVNIEFGEFDFTEKSPKGIAVIGRSEIALNSINLNLKNETEEKRIVVEFEGCENYTKRSFSLDNIKGKYNVSFTFLPGSNFDFKSFKFIYN